MMVSTLESQGYRVWTVGDDIAWMKIGEDGHLHAINPEAGFFGVAPGTGMKTNRNVMGALRQNTIFNECGDDTRSASAWWEASTARPTEGLINRKGEAWGHVQGAGGASPTRVYNRAGASDSQ
jgi:phosphoenolpyruvate carboxykinase (GTP)